MERTFRRVLFQWNQASGCRHCWHTATRVGECFQFQQGTDLQLVAWQHRMKLLAFLFVSWVTGLLLRDTCAPRQSVMRKWLQRRAALQAICQYIALVRIRHVAAD